MYYPNHNESYHEWIELYNPTSFFINVSGWTISDGQEEDSIGGDTDHGNGSTIIPPKGYALLVDHGTQVYDYLNISSQVTKLYVDDNSLCGYGLNNEHEKLFLNDSFGKTIDSIEWGYDYSDVSGFPAKTVNKGNSLSRYHRTDTNNSLLDFYYGISATPGIKNIIDFDLELYPLFLPKILSKKECSIPIAIKTILTNFSFQEQFWLKCYVVGNPISIWPATQTWNGSSWKYSTNYTTLLHTDLEGGWSDWQYLKFQSEYQEYQHHIANSTDAYFVVKCKNATSSFELIKKVTLMDLDQTTSGGIQGGFVVGRFCYNQDYLDNTTVIVTNKYGSITGISFTEDNGIESDFQPHSGYYKIASPTGSNYRINFYSNDTCLKVLTNIDISQGVYALSLTAPQNYYSVTKGETLHIPLKIENKGDFLDNIQISLDAIDVPWNVEFNTNNIQCNPQEISSVTLTITPDDGCEYQRGELWVSARSGNDMEIEDSLQLYVNITASDLTIFNISCSDLAKNQKIRFGEGELIKCKAHCKNMGNIPAAEVKVSFYYDTIDQQHFIGNIEYASVGSYQKYPSVEWDTSNIVAGMHTLLVVVDEGDSIDESNENNNFCSFPIEIYRTDLTAVSKKIIISECYYHAHTNVKNEFMTLYNPTTFLINISGWCLTNAPWKSSSDQTRVVFPQNTSICPLSALSITQNASDFIRETGKYPDFEYLHDSQSAIPQMDSFNTLTLSNAGGYVALKDSYNHTIDVVVYGDIQREFEQWCGMPIEHTGCGRILKRSCANAVVVDTNSSSDWHPSRHEGIGQSNFPLQNFSFVGEVIGFVSPDSSHKTLITEIQKAQESIYFNIYEFTHPGLGDALGGALQRNVTVNIFLEGSPIGGISDKEKTILLRLAGLGAHIRFIVQDSKQAVYARYRFDHAKYLIIDNFTVIVESCNWAKTGVPQDPTFGNREWGVVVRNERVASYFCSIFFDDWNPVFSDSYILEDMDFEIPPDFYVDTTAYSGNYKPQFDCFSVQDTFTVFPVFSPDTSEEALLWLLDTAITSIYIEQLYIYKNWSESLNPFVEKLVNKSEQGVDIKIILNYNPSYGPTNEQQNKTKQYLEEYGIQVKFIYTNLSLFTNVHNKGMIVDNTSVLISSINWNENSVLNNRESGMIIQNKDLAAYFAEVFWFDWNLQEPKVSSNVSLGDYKNPLLIVLLYSGTFALIALDWRKRKWT